MSWDYASPKKKAVISSINFLWSFAWSDGVALMIGAIAGSIITPLVLTRINLQNLDQPSGIFLGIVIVYFGVKTLLTAECHFYNHIQKALNDYLKIIIKDFHHLLLRRVQDLNLRAGISRFAGFRVRCITTLPTLHNNR